jgi:hypothetical protein
MILANDRLAAPTGGKLTLVWPLARDFSAGA